MGEQLFNPLDYPICLEYPLRIAPSAWLSHVPFGMLLVDLLQPRILVELGTEYGVSYCAFCQAVKTLNLKTRCWAIDTWRGDRHSGFYGPEVLRDLEEHHDPLYGHFSSLHVSTFDDAAEQFVPGTIDFLHIDGLHTYEAVKHDFETWLPKMSNRGVIAFHDTTVADMEFGVRIFWNELKTSYPSFEFTHGHGLGILAVGNNFPEPLNRLFATSEAQQNALSLFFRSLGQSVEASHLAIRQNEQIQALTRSLNDREREVQASARQLKDRNRLVATLSDKVEQLAIQIEEASAREAESKQEIRRPSKILDAAQVNISESRPEVKRLLTELERARSRSETYRWHLETIYGSRSWRITRPFRRTIRRLRGLFGHTSNEIEPLGGSDKAAAETESELLPPHTQPPISDRITAIAAHLLHELIERISARISTTSESQVSLRISTDYERWITEHEILSSHDAVLIQDHIRRLEHNPKLSILMPVYNTTSRHLRDAIDSVIDQIYENWELCIVDDSSTSPEVRVILEEYAERDHRIRPHFRPTNGGIAACTTTALEMSTGEWIMLMDHDDLLAVYALYLVVEAINSNPDAIIIYSDEDKIDEATRRFDPYFKPDWDYDLFLEQNLINHLGVYRSDLARHAGGFREEFEGSQDWDFALRILETVPHAKVHHIPFVLYHWRQTDSQFSRTSIANAVSSARDSINEHLSRTGQDAFAEPEGHSSYLRVKRSLPDKLPLVSIIIPTKDQARLLETCLEGVTKRTDYHPIEIVVVNNASREPDALELMATVREWPNAEVIEDRGSFNFSRLVNKGVVASTGSICVLLNNDTDVIGPNWLEEMVAHALRPDVGAVGAKLYYPDDTIQHAGVVLGIGGVAGHVHKFQSRDSPGYFNKLNLTHNVSAVTAACLATRREIFDMVGGFNEGSLGVAFNDVDFCLKVLQEGYRIVWTPDAELYHNESISRGYETTPDKIARFKSEVAYMRRTWGHLLDSDPYYNLNLSLESHEIHLAASPRVQKPWQDQSHKDGTREIHPPANILVVGKAKTGTTVLSKTICDSLPKSTYHLEPKNLSYFSKREWTGSNHVVKIIFEHWKDRPGEREDLIDNKTSVRFDKKVCIIRDPRDELISRTLYVILPWLHQNGFIEDKIEQWIGILQEKERSPSEVSFLDILDVLRGSLGVNIVEGFQSEMEDFLEFLHGPAQEMCVIRYEDFISGNRAYLQKYLGLRLLRSPDMQDLHRTYRSGSMNNWKEVFLDEDIEWSKQAIGTYVSDMGYSDWTIDTPASLDPDRYSRYVRRLINEYLNRN